MTEDEMVGWHHRLEGDEFEQALDVGDGQGGLACCDSWGHKESDTTTRLNATELKQSQSTRDFINFYTKSEIIVGTCLLASQK